MYMQRYEKSLFMLSLLFNYFSYCFSFLPVSSAPRGTLKKAVSGGSWKTARVVPLYSSQGVLPAFESGTVVKSLQDATNLKLIDIKVPDAVVKAYTNPGQYVQMKINDNKPGFYAIASPPDGRDIFTFLIKETENNKWLGALASGSTIDISLPLGKGFQIEEYFNSYRFDFPTTNVYLMATGSGLAPIASAIESNILGLKTTPKNAFGKRKAILYIGARSPDHLPLQSKYDEWRSLGVDIVPVLSGQDLPGWQGKRGYIQDALKLDSVKVPRNCGALLCGQRGMVEGAKDVLMTAGVFEGKILLNF
jgi:NAD(P)H-flavin reductase